MTGTPATSGLEKLTRARTATPSSAAGEFGKVYERYKCYACHQFNGYGGTLAPDLSFEGSRAQRQWLVQFLRNPQTLRPTLVFRMPQFNMTEQEAATLADYIGMVLQNPAVNPASVNRQDVHAAAGCTRQAALRGEISVPGVPHHRFGRRIRRAELGQCRKLAYCRMDRGLASQSTGFGAGDDRAPPRIHPRRN